MVERVFVPYDSSEYYYNTLEWDFYVGVDLGQARDFSSIAVLEVPAWYGGAEWQYFYKCYADCVDETYGGWYLPSEIGAYSVHKVRNMNAVHGREPYPNLYLRHLERVPLGTRYPDVCRRVETIVRRLRGRTPQPFQVRLVVDYTGVGRAPVDLMLEMGLPVVPILLTGASQSYDHGSYVTVPVRDLIGATQRYMEEGRLKYPAALPDLAKFKQEMQSFKRKINLRTGHDSYEAWRESDHDDLVFSVSLACWMRDVDSGGSDVACIGFTDPFGDDYEFGTAPGSR